MRHTTENFIHYSPKQGLKCLDPLYFNTNDGIKSGEVERVERFDAPLRVYGYLYDGEALPKPETGLGINIYKGQATKLYDMKKDRFKLLTLARKKAAQLHPTSFSITDGVTVYNKSIIAPVEPGSVFSFFEYFIYDLGFNGYVVYDRGIVVLFNKTKVKELKK